MEYINTQWLLDKRPEGMPEDSCWKMNKESITSLESKRNFNPSKISLHRSLYERKNE